MHWKSENNQKNTKKSCDKTNPRQLSFLAIISIKAARLLEAKEKYEKKKDNFLQQSGRNINVQ